jgi:hypothetical protein
VFLLQDSKPFFVTLQPEPARETTLGDVFIGALGITGVLVLVAAVLGGLLAIAMVMWHRRRPAEADHMPPVSPQMPAARPSSPAR